MAANSAPEQVSSSSQPNGSGGGGGKLVSLISILNLVVTLGMLGVLFLSFQKEKKRQGLQDINAQASAEGEGKSVEGEKAKEGEAKSEKPKEGKEGEAKEGKEGKESKEGEKKKLPEYGKMITLEQFTINLLTPGSLMPKYVRVNISIEVPSSDVEEEVNAKLPMVRNVIIDLFNSKRPSDLSTAENRDYLKEEIQTTLDGFLTTGKIKGVYFTSFSLSG